jgi:hypothetical protein
MMSVKRISRIRRDRHVIRYFSQKAKRALILESFLELWLACKLEGDSSVNTFASQPESMNLEIDGQIRRFTPDFLVSYNDGTAKYIEVHHERFTSDDYREKVAAFDRYSRKTTGVSIELITRDSLNEIELVNYLLLTQSCSLDCSVIIDESTLPDKTTVRGLIAIIKENSTNPIGDAYRIMLKGVYQFETNTLVTSDTILYRSALSC